LWALFDMKQHFFRPNRLAILFLIVVSLVGLFFSPFLAWANTEEVPTPFLNENQPTPAVEAAESSLPVQATKEAQPTMATEATESSSTTPSPTLSLVPSLASFSASPSSITAVLREDSPEATQEATNVGEASPSSFLERILLHPIRSIVKYVIKGKRPSLSKDNFQAKEKIKIDLGNYQSEEIVVSLTFQGEEVLEDQEASDDALEISRPRNFKPGKYHLNIKDKETEKILFDQDFTWGVLAINTNRSVYTPGQTAKISLAVLDEEGMMVCDAKLKLKIQSSNVKTTEDGTIRVNPECEIHGFTLRPDYEAEYQVAQAGVYEMELTAETENGRYAITDSFMVKDEVPFDVERITATRIYPPQEYPVVFKININQDFKGEIVEAVPQDFEIITPDFKETTEFRVEENDNQKEKLLIWPVDFGKGEILNK